MHLFEECVLIGGAIPIGIGPTICGIPDTIRDNSDIRDIRDTSQSSDDDHKAEITITWISMDNHTTENQPSQHYAVVLPAPDKPRRPADFEGQKLWQGLYAEASVRQPPRPTGPQAPGPRPQAPRLLEAHTLGAW